MTKNLVCEGIVIKRSNLGEADRLLTLFTKNHGKITLLAKGIRKVSSKRSGSLELFNWVKCQMTSGRGQLDILTEVKLIESFPHWRRQLGKISLAYQVCELIDKLTPDHQPHIEIFDLLVSALSQISTFGTDWELQIANLKLKILTELGYWSKDKVFAGDINNLIEELSQRPFHSHKLLNKLK